MLRFIWRASVGKSDTAVFSNSAKVLPIHKAQLLSYMKLLNVPVGLLLNFDELKLVDGGHPLNLQGASRWRPGQKKKKIFYRR
jgi:hypothetical protein